MRKVIIGLLAVLVLAVIWLGAVGVEPQDRRPGTRLSGTVQAHPNDWSFTDGVMEVHVEVRPWWQIPYSVTVVLGRDGDRLYSPSIYSEAAEFPGTKLWNTVLAGNPDVRLRVGTDIYELALKPATDPAEFDRGFRALAAKYPFWKTALDDPAKRPHFVILAYSRRDPSG